MKKIIYAISVLSGTIIGVGLFSLPYIASKVGIFVMLGYFLVLGALVIILHLFFGELSLKTPDFKRLPGFAKIHLGGWGQGVAYISTILGLFGAILAYLIVGGEFLGNLLKPVFGGTSLIYTLLYFSLGAILIFFGIKTIAKVEFWGLILFFLVLILIFFREKNLINIGNLFLIGNWKWEIGNLFLPYGAILFSLWGAALIPEVEEMLAPTPNEDKSPSATKIGGASPRYGVGVKEKKKALRWIIPISILIPILVYLFFIYLILGITGLQTTESALTGLRNFLSNEVVSLGFFFGVLTTFTSFIALGLTLKNVFCYDLKIEKNLAWAITCFLPLTVFLVGVRSFIPIISLVGGVMLGIDGVLIILMYRACKKIRRFSFFYFLTSFLMLILAFGILYEVLYFLKTF